MRKRANILAVAIGIVAAVGFATNAGVRRAASECAAYEYIDDRSELQRFCDASWLLTAGPVLVATAVAAALAAVAVWLRRPELLVILAAVGFIPAGMPEDRRRAADPEGPELVEVTRDRQGTPITPQPDRPLAPPPPAPLQSEVRTRDDDAYMASVNVLQVVGECIVKSDSQPRRCEDPSLWRASGIATDARITVTIRNRDVYRVDAESSAPASPPVVHSATFDDRHHRILYTCRPRGSPRCGNGHAESKLPR